MDTTEAVAEVSASAPAVAAGKPVDCLIHVRFNPDGTVLEIGERPKGVVAQTWFKYLSQHTCNCYQALAGGRGMFRLPRLDVDAMKTACIAAEQGS